MKMKQDHQLHQEWITLHRGLWLNHALEVNQKYPMGIGAQKLVQYTPLEHALKVNDHKAIVGYLADETLGKAQALKIVAKVYMDKKDHVSRDYFNTLIEGSNEIEVQNFLDGGDVPADAQLLKRLMAKAYGEKWYLNLGRKSTTSNHYTILNTWHQVLLKLYARDWENTLLMLADLTLDTDESKAPAQEHEEFFYQLEIMEFLPVMYPQDKIALLKIKGMDFWLPLQIKFQGCKDNQEKTDLAQRLVAQLTEFGADALQGQVATGDLSFLDAVRKSSFGDKIGAAWTKLSRHSSGAPSHSPVVATANPVSEVASVQVDIEVGSFKKNLSATSGDVQGTLTEKPLRREDIEAMVAEALSVAGTDSSSDTNTASVYSSSDGDTSSDDEDSSALAVPEKTLAESIEQWLISDNMSFGLDHSAAKTGLEAIMGVDKRVDWKVLQRSREKLETQRASEAAEDPAATRIAAFVRGQKARAEYNVVRKVATDIARIFRGQKARKEYNTTRQAATTIASVTRGKQGRNKANRAAFRQAEEAKRAAYLESVQKNLREYLEEGDSRQPLFNELRQEKNVEFWTVIATGLQNAKFRKEEKAFVNLLFRKYQEQKDLCVQVQNAAMLEAGKEEEAANYGLLSFRQYVLDGKLLKKEEWKFDAWQTLKSIMQLVSFFGWFFLIKTAKADGMQGWFNTRKNLQESTLEDKAGILREKLYPIVKAKVERKKILAAEVEKLRQEAKQAAHEEAIQYAQKLTATKDYVKSILPEDAKELRDELRVETNFNVLQALELAARTYPEDEQIAGRVIAETILAHGGLKKYRVQKQVKGFSEVLPNGIIDEGLLDEVGLTDKKYKELLEAIEKAIANAKSEAKPSVGMKFMDAAKRFFFGSGSRVVPASPHQVQPHLRVKPTKARSPSPTAVPSFDEQVRNASTGCNSEHSFIAIAGKI
jgi:hypothetical protein